MHDHCTVITSNRLFTLYHVDPERDGSDDSCGWFMRSRHCDQTVLDRIVKDFEFEWSHGVPFGWFDADGNPNYSPQSIVLSMFRIAANNHFGHWSRRSERFLRDHTFDILHFAENSCDSLWSGITRHYERKHDEPERRAERIRSMAGCIYSWILRADRPWWRHPKWHVHHWKIQFHPWQDLKRRFWDKCCRCGRRGFRPGESAIGSWSGDQIWHSGCDDSIKPNEVPHA